MKPVGPPTELAALASALAEPGGGARVVRGRAARFGRRAAVLILFSLDAAAHLRVVLIEKSPKLRNHAGQLAFPGGGVEPTDASSEEAALREAREEVGIEAATVDLLGVLPPAAVAATGYHVTSVVGWWREPHPLEVVDQIEVAAVHNVPVPALIEPSNRVTWVHPAGYQGPAFLVDDLFIWGFTGHVLDGILKVAGWEQPWDDRRTSDIPERFLRSTAADNGQ